MAFDQQRSEGERLGRRPVDVLAGLDHLALGFELARDLAVEVEVCRHFGEAEADLLQGLQRHRRLAAALVEADRYVEPGPRASLTVDLVGLVVAGVLEIMLEAIVPVTHKPNHPTRQRVGRAREGKYGSISVGTG